MHNENDPDRLRFIVISTHMHGIQYCESKSICPLPDLFILFANISHLNDSD